MILSTLIFLFVLSSIFWGPIVWLFVRVRRALNLGRREALRREEQPAGRASAEAHGPDLVVPYRVIKVEG